MNSKRADCMHLGFCLTLDQSPHLFPTNMRTDVCRQRIHSVVQKSDSKLKIWDFFSFKVVNKQVLEL